MTTQVHPQQALGSLGLRLAAVIIDGLVISVPFLVLAGLAGAADSAGGIVLIYLLFIVATFVYAPMTMARKGENNGQTFGKQWLGLRVVHASGTPMTGGRAVMREIVGRALPGSLTCGIYSLVDAVFPVFEAKNQAIHDKIAGTYVVRADVDPRIGMQLEGGGFVAQQPSQWEAPQP